MKIYALCVTIVCFLLATNLIENLNYKEVLEIKLDQCESKLKSCKLGFKYSKLEILNRVYTISESQEKATLVMAVIKAESDFIVDAQSSKGALGLMQLLPTTAQEEYEKTGESISLKKISNLLIEDPGLNIQLGINYLDFLHLLHKDVTSVKKRRLLVLASYNAGIHKVKRSFGCNGYKCYIKRANLSNKKQFNKALGSLPDETISYLKKTEFFYQSYKRVL
ncbi:MAG: transglycosylase SLT domain-containing protein [Candidatus Ranarchaeia archaeon]